MLIERDRSIIIACDVLTLGLLIQLIKETRNIDVVQGYKIGMTLFLRHGLNVVVNTIRRLTNKKIILDYQKAGCDIPKTGEDFAQICAEARVDAVIIFPLAGPETASSWIRACFAKNLHVLVGGEMTHPKFLSSDGGYIEDGAPLWIYEKAIREGVRDFVVPGNKPAKIRQYKTFLDGYRDINGDVFDYTLYSPGLISQGGRIGMTGRAAGDRWHCIIGRAIYQAKNREDKVKELAKQL
jgi:orotidine-5'-phosphate decarboxylase